jgi:hypothetical protein
VREGFDDLYEGIIRELYQRAAQEEGPRPDARNYLLGADGTFLGKLTSNRYDPDGILNQYGPHGSRYSTESIFNQYGPYGSKYSDTSPWNPYAQQPPEIYLNNRRTGRLTVNRFLPGATEPTRFIQMVKERPEYRY